MPIYSLNDWFPYDDWVPYAERRGDEQPDNHFTTVLPWFHVYDQGAELEAFYRTIDYYDAGVTYYRRKPIGTDTLSMNCTGLDMEPLKGINIDNIGLDDMSFFSGPIQ